MRNIALATVGLAALLWPAVHAVAQPAPTPSPNPVPAAGPRTLLNPGEAYGATYGTNNLALPPAAVVPPHVPSAQRTLRLSPADVLEIQNARRQPPATIDPFAAYVRSDPLIAQLATAGTADPAALVLLAWNHVALDMTSIDHTTAGVPNMFEATYAEQFGPPRSSRALAMVHLAMFEAANVIDPHFASYKSPGAAGDLKSMVLGSLLTGTPAPTVTNASISGAVSQAAFSTLAALYPNKRGLLEAARLVIEIGVTAQEGSKPGDAPSRLALGRQIGARAADVVLDARANDGSKHNAHNVPCTADGPTPPTDSAPAPLCWETYFPKMIPAANPQDWTADEIVPNRLQLGATWSMVTPFVLQPHEFITDAGLVLPSGPRALPTAAGLEANLPLLAYGPMIPDPHGGPSQINSQYGVRDYGGWGPAPGLLLPTFPASQGKRALTTTKRDAMQTQWAQFWGYDATALLCAPPRLYNMVATSYLLQNAASSTAPHSAVEVARYLALVNIAMADAGISAWDAKFKYHMARPITFIRHYANGNEDDAVWTPLGQVASNGAVTNVTPPFPAYPSGHAVFGGALFTTVAKIMGADKQNSAFDFVSDEYNGHTIGGDGQPRPLITAHYVSLGAAEWENAESRIWLGIHWQADADDGSALGDAIGDAVTSRILQPL